MPEFIKKVYKLLIRNFLICGKIVARAFQFTMQVY